MALPYADPTNTGQWAHDLLSALGDPQTASNVGYIEAWEQRESPSGYGYNPLGTEETAKGSTNANSAGVQAFRSWLSGLNATVATFKGDPANQPLELALSEGNASLGTLAGAQAGGSWATGAEKDINALGTPHAFTYGGAQGEVPGAVGIAAVSGDTQPNGHTFLSTVLSLGGHLPGGGVESAIPDNPSSITKSLASSVFGPVAGWIEEGAADVTFIGFGLLLIVIGLVVTFKDTSAGQSTIAVTKDAAVGAVAS